MYKMLIFGIFIVKMYDITTQNCQNL